MKAVAAIVALLAIAALTALGGNTTPAAAQQSLPAPAQVAVANGPNPGEVIIGWTKVPDAAFYRIGWVASNDYQAISAAGGNPLEALAFIDVSNRGQNVHTLKRLTPGVEYNFLVGSNDARYGRPKYSPAGASLTLNSSPGSAIGSASAKVTWKAVAGAKFYRIAWAAVDDQQAISAAGGNLLEAFAFIDVSNRGQTEHTVTRLTPGIEYQFIVGSKDNLHGTPQWFSGPTTLTPGSSQSGTGKMYWTDVDTGKIHRANLDGTQVEEIPIPGRDIPHGIALDLSAGKMYWTHLDIGKIRRANLDGTQVEDLIASGLGTPWGIVLDVPAGKMYWADYQRDKIQRANLDGSQIEDLVTGLGNVHSIDLDTIAGKIYWADHQRDKIQRANLDGSQVEDLVTRGRYGHPWGIALDVSAGKMYWTVLGAGKIYRANLDGSDVQDLVTSDRLRSTHGIALDVSSGKMYWTDISGGKIQRANLDGTQVEDLVTSGLVHPDFIVLSVTSTQSTYLQSMPQLYWVDEEAQKIQRTAGGGRQVEDQLTAAQGLNKPGSIALDLDAGKMYYTDDGEGVIGRANLDGSDVQILAMANDPVGIALDLGARKMYWIERTQGEIWRADLEGDGSEAVVSWMGGFEPYQIALDPSERKMYVTLRKAHGIVRLNLDDPADFSDFAFLQPSVGTSAIADPMGLALDLSRGRMYWTERHQPADKIRRANLDGSGAQDLITSAGHSLSGIALDVVVGKMYWTDEVAGAIKRADLDGGNEQTVVTGLNAPEGIAFTHNDRAVLEALYNAAGGNEWTYSTNWFEPDLSTWLGVTVEEATGRVTRLDLNDLNLIGEIPEELEYLTALETLRLEGNELEGCMPQGGNLPSAVEAGRQEWKAKVIKDFGARGGDPDAPVWQYMLFSASLAAVEFGGTSLQRVTTHFIAPSFSLGLPPCPPEAPFPADWPSRADETTKTDAVALLAIRYYYVTTHGNEANGANKLNVDGGWNGSLLAYASNPRSADCLANDPFAGIHGVTAEEIDGCYRVTRLNFADRGLQGGIPPDIARLGELKRLNLSQNQLTGTIPPELGNLSNLYLLALNDNRLSGAIPAALGNLDGGTLDDDSYAALALSAAGREILDLHLQENQLSGFIPPALANIGYLRTMKIDPQSNAAGEYNLEGCLPSNLVLDTIGVLPKVATSLIGKTADKAKDLLGVATPTDKIEGAVNDGLLETQSIQRRLDGLEGETREKQLERIEGMAGNVVDASKDTVKLVDEHGSFDSSTPYLSEDLMAKILLKGTASLLKLMSEVMSIVESRIADALGLGDREDVACGQFENAGS